MKRVEVKLNLEAVAPLLDVIKAAADELRPTLALEAVVPEHDEDLAAQWHQDLLSSQHDDLAVLLGLFGSEFFGAGIIGLDSSNAEPVLRACAALRLRLRATRLESVADESLERGDVSLGTLPEATRRAFAAYVFLASLQEIVVQYLDPTVLE